jgi:hypothetical protein
MYPDSALSAGQLAIMAVVVAAALAAWLIAVFLAARQPRGISAAANAGSREEEAASTVTQLPSGARPADKAAALSGKAQPECSCTSMAVQGAGTRAAKITEGNW